MLFKNIYYNKYLAIKTVLKTNGKGSHKKMRPYLTEDINEDNCEFEIRFDERSGDEVKFIRIVKNIEQQEYALCIDQVLGEKKNVKRTCVIEPFRSNDLQSLHYRDVFKLVTPSADDLWVALFLTEQKHHLQKCLLRGFKPSLLARSLRLFSQFLQNKLPLKVSAGHKYGEIVKNRQMFMREYALMELLVSLLQDLSEKAVRREHAAYFCIKKIFKILKLMTYDNVGN